MTGPAIEDCSPTACIGTSSAFGALDSALAPADTDAWLSRHLIDLSICSNGLRLCSSETSIRESSVALTTGTTLSHWQRIALNSARIAVAVVARLSPKACMPWSARQGEGTPMGD